MKKIIVIGASGRTGAYFVDYCMNHIDSTKYEIIPVGTRKTEFFERYGLHYYQVDITREEEFKKLPTSDVYAVVLLAAVLPAYMNGYNPKDYIFVNIIGALNTLEYCRKVKADRILYPQTESDISGHWDKEFKLSPFLERNFSFTGDHSLYVISKNTAVDMIEHYHQTYGLKRFIFRCPTIYSYTPSPYYYVDGKKQMLAYRYMFERAINGDEIEMWGDPNRAKDIVYVKDFCQMLYKALFVNKNEGFYNVGTGVATTLRDQIEGMIEVFSPQNKKSTIKACPDKPNSRNFVMDILNAKEDLGYEPQYYYLDYLKDFKREMKIDRFKDLREIKDE